MFFCLHSGITNPSLYKHCLYGIIHVQITAVISTCNSNATFLFSLLSPGDSSGWIRTLELVIMSQMFDHCANSDATLLN
jgi:hypothetical protein